MKIISYLNVSNISNLEADSGYIFQRCLLGEWVRRGYEVVLIGPPEMPKFSERIQVVKINFADDKYGVRLGFPWEELSKKLASHAFDTDVILVNQSELTLNLSTLMAMLSGRKVPCATYFHYLAIEERNDIDGSVIYDSSLDLYGLAKSIWKRQVESALHSDCNIIGSNWGKSLFLKSSGYAEKLQDKFVVIPPPVQHYKPSKLVTDKQSITLLYNHRLYEHYGSRQVFEWLHELRSMDVPPFRVWVTDPTGKRSSLRQHLDKSVNEIKTYLASLDFVDFKHFATQKEYYAALQYVDIGLTHFRQGALWSMATTDMMSAGKPVIALNAGGLPELIDDPDLLFNSKEEFLKLVMQLLLDPQYRLAKGEQAKKRTQILSIKHIGEQFSKVLLDIVERCRE